MAVNATNNNSSGAAPGAGVSITGNSASETSDMFTKLLVAQIQNQDPLSPTDPAQFVQQLTQLSQTESLQNLSNLTSASASVLQSMQVIALGGQVGSDVMAQTGSVTLDGSTAVNGQITLTSASTDTQLVLTGADGVKHNVKLGTVKPGDVPFSIDPAALGLPAGTYTMSVQTSSKEVDPPIEIQGRLNSVRLLQTGGASLNISNVGDVDPKVLSAFNGKSVKPASVTSI
jgi:flagellar basal-body rod modification protein FlgD